MDRSALLRDAAVLRRLSDDLERIACGEAPTAADLEGAPLLDGWGLVPVAAPCLMGSVFGHPRLGTKERARTSMLEVLDADGMWARTRSRFYRLGLPAAFREAGHG